MFEKLGQSAEQVATNVSRRQFLGRLSRAALGLAGFAGSLLIACGTAAAGRNKSVCYYSCPDGSVCNLLKNNCNGCPNKLMCSGMSCTYLSCERPSAP